MQNAEAENILQNQNQTTLPSVREVNR